MNVCTISKTTKVLSTKLREEEEEKNKNPKPSENKTRKIFDRTKLFLNPSDLCTSINTNISLLFNTFASFYKVKTMNTND